MTDASDASADHAQPDETEITLSVVIPTSSVDDRLLAQIDRVCAQVGAPPFEVIVVLNSADASHLPSLHLHAAGAARPVRVVTATERFSAAYARNTGVVAAHGSVIAFCDADDLVRDTWLAGLVAGLVDADAVGGQLAEFADNGELPKWRPPLTPGALPEFLGVPYLVSASMAIGREAFEAVGGFDESLTRSEDIAFSWRLIRAGYRLGFVPEAVVDYRVRGSMRQMLRQHFWYGVGQSEVLIRDGRPGEHRSAGLFTPNNQAGGLGSPVAVLRKISIGSGRLYGAGRERLHRRRTSGG